VKVGKQNDKWVQILAGLSEGEEVLLAPPSGLPLAEVGRRGRTRCERDKERRRARRTPIRPSRDAGR